MPGRKFTTVFICVTCIWLAAVLSLTVWEQKVVGDLSRVGRWPERDFGARTNAAYLPVLANAVTPQVSIAVLGDSFARPNIWQSMLTERSGASIASWQFADHGSCIRDWALKVVKNQTQVRTIVLQSVERVVLYRLIERFDCDTDQSLFPETQAGMASEERSYWPLTMDLEYLGRSLLNTIKENVRADDEVRSEVVNVPLSRSDLFSNRRSDRMLYFTDDEPEWRAPPEKVALAVRNLLRLKALLEEKGVRLVVIIVPDKSNVYRPLIVNSRLPAHKPELAQALSDAGVIAPRFLEYFRDQALRSVDFYLPDDTHLSLAGYEYLGREIADFWQKSLVAGDSEETVSAIHPRVDMGPAHPGR